MTVKIKLSTGLVTRECDTGMDEDEWKLLAHEEKEDWYIDTIAQFIEVWAETEDGELL